jgi:uncharacterized membrane protein YphA (DoxX/SURF4 family)
MAYKSIITETAEAICRLLLALVFIYAGVAKLIDHQYFPVAIARYQILPHSLVLPMALYLPWLEIVTGVSVFFSPFSSGALLLQMLLCAAFSTAIASALYRGLNIDCGCFGLAVRHSTLLFALFRSIALGILATVLYIRRERIISHIESVSST